MEKIWRLSIFPAILILTVVFLQPDLLAAPQDQQAADIESAVSVYLDENFPGYSFEILGICVRDSKDQPVFKYMSKNAKPDDKPMMLDFYGAAANTQWLKNKFWRVWDCPPDVSDMKGYAQIRAYGKTTDLKCWVKNDGTIIAGPGLAKLILKSNPYKKFATKVPLGNVVVRLKQDINPDYSEAQKDYIFNIMGYKDEGDKKSFIIYQARVNQDAKKPVQVKEFPFSFSPQAAFDKVYPAAIQSIKSVHPDYQLSFINWGFQDNEYKLVIDYRPERRTIDHWRYFLDVDASSGKVVSSWHGLYLNSNHIKYTRGQE